MGCSCKSGNKQTVYVPSMKMRTSVKAGVLSNSSSYDFSSTVTPFLYCEKCVIKHLSFALLLLDYPQTIDICIAQGLLLCAADHMISTNPISYKKLIMTAHLVLEDKLKARSNIIKLLSNINSKDIYEVDLWRKRTPIMLLTKAYSLLFTLISYEKINLHAATGAITHASFMYMKMNMSLLAKALRLLWKLALLIQPYNQLYYNTRSRLLKLILKAYNNYKKENHDGYSNSTEQVVTEQ